jgi:hypothetical protein
MINRLGAAFGAAALMTFDAAPAHHAFSMFDMTQTMTLSGTVKEFQWNNPHSFIQLFVTKDGAVREWSIEMGSPMQLMRIGWKPKSVRVGDKITVRIHPTREANNGGSFVSAIAADGSPLGN